MDTDQQTTLAQQNDPNLGARIVKDIAQIESDYRAAEGPISQRFMEEAEAVIRKAAPDNWVVGKTEWSIMLAHPEWKPTKGLGKGDAWFELSEIGPEEGDEHTWIGVAVGAGQSKLGLEFMVRPGLADAAASLWRDKSYTERWAKIGVSKTETGRLFVPIVVDRMRLSKAFSENDLAQALVPIAKATEALATAKTEVDALIQAVRDKGKRR